MWIPIETVKIGKVGPVKILEDAKDYGGDKAELEKTMKFGWNLFWGQGKNKKHEIGTEADEIKDWFG